MGCTECFLLYLPCPTLQSGGVKSIHVRNVLWLDLSVHQSIALILWITDTWGRCKGYNVVVFFGLLCLSYYFCIYAGRGFNVSAWSPQNCPNSPLLQPDLKFYNTDCCFHWQPMCLSGVRSLCFLLADNVPDLKVKVFTVIAFSQWASGSPKWEYAKKPQLAMQPRCWLLECTVCNHNVLCAEGRRIREHLFSSTHHPHIVQWPMWILVSLFSLLLKLSFEYRNVLLLPWAFG